MDTAQNPTVMNPRIAILGAGVSGLAAAKQLSRYNPIVFEASDSIGGVWKHCSYNSTKLQSLRCDYEFSDFPWPDQDNSSFPSHTQILDYLQAYTTRFDLMKFIRFNSKVVEVCFVGDQKPTDNLADYGSLLPGQPVWEVAVQTHETESVQWHSFEFLVTCIGKYGDIPKIPSFPQNKGPEIFQGQVLHTIDYSKLDHEAATELLKGKKVVVVGYKKSGIDLAMECAEANQGAARTFREWNKQVKQIDSSNNDGKKMVYFLGPEGQPCTMIVRTIHWTVPHYWIWGLPFFLFYSTRSSQFLHEKPNQTLLRTCLCFLLSPLRRVISKFIESYLVWKLPLNKYGLKPDHPFEEDYASCQMAIMPENFFSEADKGRIVFKRPNKWWFWEGGIEFDDGNRLEAEVVIFATGYDGKKKLKSILPEPFRSLMEFPSGIMPLYRATIHPLIPNMAFLGYVESVSNLHSAELQSKWLSHLLDEKFQLPGVENMLEQTTNEIKVMKRATRFYKRHCISVFSINHDDELCRDMGWDVLRKKNWLAEAFSPYTSQDYDKEE